MRIILLVIFSTSIEVFVEGSSNGGYYTCSPTDSDTLPCFFSATSSAPFTTAIPHNIDTDIAPDGYRIVKDENGNNLSMSAKPWTNGDVLSTTCAPIYSDLYAYTLAFEMVAPLRDQMMFEPDAINQENWAALTKVFKDCKIKEEDTVDGMINIWSTDSVYKVVTMSSDNPAAGTARGGYHHGILQFLEEGAIDLVCLMCPSFSMGGDHERCDDARSNLGIDTSCPTRSSCWEAAYGEMYGYIPVIEETTTLEKESGCTEQDHTVTAGGCVTPVEDPVEAPVEAPVETPVQAPVEAPVETPVEAPVEAPVGPPDDTTMGQGPPDDTTMGQGPPDDTTMGGSKGGSTTGGGSTGGSTTGGGSTGGSTAGGGSTGGSTAGGGSKGGSTTGRGSKGGSTTGGGSTGGSTTGGGSKGGSTTGGGSTGGSTKGRSSSDGGIDTKMAKEMFLRKVGGR